MSKSKDLTQCNKDGCTEPRVVNRGSNTLCREHKNEFNRKYRAENPDKVKETNIKYFTKNEGDIYFDKGTGYFLRMGFGHPACSPGGLTSLHRIILWDKLSGKDTPCAECGEMVFWNLPYSDPNSLCTDHINEDKTDNRPENLDPVHSACNTKRAFRNAAKRKATANTSEELTA